MILRSAGTGSAWTLSLRDASLTVSHEDTRIAAYDRGGRLYTFVDGGDTYRRGLNGRILHKWQDQAGRHRAWLAAGDADRIVDAAASLIHRAQEARAPGAAHSSRSTPVAWQSDQVPAADAERALGAALAGAAGFDSAAARADAARFAAVYAPVGILPPDQYLALVLQATEGCAFGTCTFCDLYREPYRVKSVPEFRQHVARVRDYMGASLRLRGRSVFLGAANALAAPAVRLRAILEVVGDEFGSPGRLPAVYAFVDGFTGARKTVADYRALAALGLRRVYIGLESGHDPLLSFVQKPGTARDALDTVRALKAAGVQVGVIVMVGLGGHHFRAGHLADTVTVVNAMALGAGDLLYLSDLVAIPGAGYPRLAAAAGLTDLDPAELAQDRRVLRSGFRWPGTAPQVATYDVREFVY